MTLAELHEVVDWAAAEGWNPGLRDAEAFFAADPAGFLLNEAGGVKQAAIAAIRLSEGQGFIGLYIARPGARGQGHGLAVWAAGMARLAGGTVGLDGVLAQQANYRKSGFALAWNNARYQAAAPHLAAPIAADAARLDQELLDFDAAHAGMARPAFLAAWLGTPGHVALVARQAGRICAFGVIRPCREGSKIGPLFAPDALLAAGLLAALAAYRVPGPLVLDLPEDNAAAVALAHGCGMTKVFETARMYAGPPPEMNRPGIFGITSFELG